MRILNGAAIAAALCIGLGVSAAYADEANVTTCLSLGDQVKTALQTNSQSAAYQDATKEQRYGLEFCNNGFYARGAGHYNRALQMLGSTAKN